MNEADLQRTVIQMLKDKKITRAITNIGVFRGRRKASKPGFREYSVRNILTDRYDSAVVWIFDRLANWDIQLVGGVKPTNISLTKTDRLFPDIVAYDDNRNFIVFELKVGSKTEREAVTELFAYVFELRTLMPNLNNHEISLVIIGENFGTLLSHAVLQVLSFFGLKVMCLRPLYMADLHFEIVDPLRALGMEDHRLSEDSFSVYSICLYQERNISPKANRSILRILKVAEDMLLDRANRLGSNGFYFAHENRDISDEVGSVARYYLTIALVDPFKLLNMDALLMRKTNISKILLDMAQGCDSHLQNHFWELTREAVGFLNKFYAIRYETPVSYRQFSRSLGGWRNVSAISCNVWGEFGEFVREMIYAPKTGGDFFNEELDHTNPFCLWEVFEHMFENEPAEPGYQNY
ncbi:hypothetical protein [Pseudomonas chlororaphis]|uniref:hypothetical protein n=1 Tax=Pseudomonas chlororaphis TaxID=587753 RepID=UPI001B30EAA5|nr:hypothetical protein [Pseudomonas chlororaphis]QTT88508.1 hypothetical protein HUT28_14390 [Pseudomonas chlororaphis]